MALVLCGGGVGIVVVVVVIKEGKGKRKEDENTSRAVQHLYSSSTLLCGLMTPLIFN